MTTTAIPTLTATAELTALRAAWDQGNPAPTMAAHILAAPLRTEVGGMVIYTAGWSRETADRADATAGIGTDAWIAALGAHEHATMTSDGRSATRNHWCDCTTDMGCWVRYEHWTAAGMTAHGYVCRTCRQLKQTG
jgi:hypothetical protein